MTAIFLILLLIATLYHTALGLQVVIEDYLEREWARLATLLLMRLLCVLFAVRGILAVLKLALGA
jgi:succinate dehydrogenase / fumarate reductase membrane anchor subunit